VTPEERFWTKVDKTDDCWLWTAARNRHGYGVCWNGTSTMLAHRFAYGHPIPDGLQIDHLCRVRHCVNPDHLELVTNRENWRRGQSHAAVAQRTGRCKYGHSLADAYRDKNGHVRNCGTCKRQKRSSGEWSRGVR
jgi:hypothetical protein